MVISSSESSPKSPVRRFKPFEGVRVLGFFTLTAAFFLILLVFFFFFSFYLNNGSRRFGMGGNGVGGAYNGWGLGTVRSSFILGDGECDLFEGKWVWDERYPLYDSKDCAFLDEGFRCTENGRPDRFYEKWRWQPSHCNLPRFDAKKMLEKLRNRRVVFVGDSIGRNQWESLLCMLSSAVPDKKSIYEVNGSPITKHRGFLIFMFVDYNCTVEYYRSPFLVTQSRAPAGVPEKVKMTLKLDSIDWMSYKWRDADVLIFNSAHWWNYEKTIRSGCYFQMGDEVKMEMSVESAYYKAIGTLFDWINNEVNTSRTEVIFRTYAPVHFRGGDWKTGGNCHRETLPELVSSQISTKTWSHFLNPFSNMTLLKPPHAPLAALEVLNVTQLTAQRRDGHLSLYYLGPSSPAPIHKQDCSHWCLPGIPDTWNELLYAIFLRSQQQKSS